MLMLILCFHLHLMFQMRRSFYNRQHLLHHQSIGLHPLRQL